MPFIYRLKLYALFESDLLYIYKCLIRQVWQQKPWFRFHVSQPDSVYFFSNCRWYFRLTLTQVLMYKHERRDMYLSYSNYMPNGCVTQISCFTDIDFVETYIVRHCAREGMDHVLQHSYSKRIPQTRFNCKRCGDHVPLFVIHVLLKSSINLYIVEWIKKEVEILVDDRLSIRVWHLRSLFEWVEFL